MHVNCLCSDHGGAGSFFSGDKSFDEPAWGTFDTNDDLDSLWGFNSVSTTRVSGQFLSICLMQIFTNIIKKFKWHLHSPCI